MLAMAMRNFFSTSRWLKIYNIINHPKSMEPLGENCFLKIANFLKNCNFVYYGLQAKSVLNRVKFAII